MRVRLLAIGNKQPTWVSTGFQTYAKRFPPTYPFEFIEIPAEKRANMPVARILEIEGEKLFAKIKPDHHIIALDVKGQQWSTEVFAEKLKNFHTKGQNIDFVIGGADGLSEKILAKAHTRWSLSPLTFPHGLVHIMVVEQLYRAISILQNHPYHRI
jgi:23S rRNA (pseudouridine1915-N3)-methyltransferase